MNHILTKVTFSSLENFSKPSTNKFKNMYRQTVSKMQNIAARFSSSSSRCPNTYRIKMLTKDFYVRNYACIPIVILAFCDCCWMAFCTIEGFMRTDVVLTRKTRQQGELTELLLEPVNRKFLTFTQTFPPNPKLHKAYEDMKCAEEKRREECAEKANK